MSPEAKAIWLVVPSSSKGVDKKGYRGAWEKGRRGNVARGQLHSSSGSETGPRPPPRTRDGLSILSLHFKTDNHLAQGGGSKKGTLSRGASAPDPRRADGHAGSPAGSTAYRPARECPRGATPAAPARPLPTSPRAGRARAEAAAVSGRGKWNKQLGGPGAHDGEPRQSFKNKPAPSAVPSPSSRRSPPLSGSPTAPGARQPRRVPRGPFKDSGEGESSLAARPSPSPGGSGSLSGPNPPARLPSGSGGGSFPPSSMVAAAGDAAAAWP